MRYFYLLILLICFISIKCTKELTEPTKTNDNLPVINKISIIHYPTMQDSVFRGDIGVELECDSYDNDGFIADYIWEATGGTIRGAAYHARWDAPTGVPDIYNIICTVKDNDNNIARKEFAVDVLNRAPIIERIYISQTSPSHQPYIKIGDKASFYSIPYDPDGDNVQFKYILPDTTTDWMWQQIFDWTAPANLPYTNKCYGLLRDEYGAVAKDSVEFYVY